MEARKDFLNTLDSDASIMILMCLDHISDLVRASSVSCSWRHFGKIVLSILLFMSFYSLPSVPSVS